LFSPPRLRHPRFFIFAEIQPSSRTPLSIIIIVATPAIAPHPPDHFRLCHLYSCCFLPPTHYRRTRASSSRYSRFCKINLCTPTRFLLPSPIYSRALLPLGAITKCRPKCDSCPPPPPYMATACLVLSSHDVPPSLAPRFASAFACLPTHLSLCLS
jgi:hypothetical protein